MRKSKFTEHQILKIIRLYEAGSKVALDLEFEFDSRALDLVVGAFFEEACNSLVDAFTERAAVVYGRNDG